MINILINKDRKTMFAWDAKLLRKLFHVLEFVPKACNYGFQYKLGYNLELVINQPDGVTARTRIPFKIRPNMRLY